MITLDMELLLEVVMSLSHLRQHTLQSKIKGVVKDDELAARVLDMYEHLFACGLPVTAESVMEITESMMAHESADVIAKQIQRFNWILVKEFAAKAIMLVPSERVKYNVKPNKLFGEKVCEAFPSAVDDIEEAGKCLAFGRGTAGVFHLMRVTETGLKAVALPLGIPYAPSWESYIGQITKKITVKHRTKTVQWKRDEPYFTELLGDFQAVKLAWRNPTMHIVRRYTPEEADDVFVAVRALMGRLSLRFKDKKVPKV